MAAQRLAGHALGSLAPAADVAAVIAYEPDSGYHEFDGEFVVDLTAHAREPGAYLAMFVLASAVALLYQGRIIDEARFFPRQDPSEVFRRCFAGSCLTARDLWQSLQEDRQ